MTLGLTMEEEVTVAFELGRTSPVFRSVLGTNNGIAGPHPIAQRQVIFRTSAFAEVVPWLMFNRQGLDILIHPLSDDEFDDHTANALWLGNPVPLKLEILQHGPYPPGLFPTR